jgi:tetratricopeptide (TPR) repeat protein
LLNPREMPIGLKIAFLGALAWVAFSLIPILPAEAQDRGEALRHYSRGEALAKAGRIEAATREFAQAVSFDPGNPGFRERLAWLLLDHHNPGAARPQFERLLLERPNRKEAITGLAICHLRLGHPERAVRVLDQGLRFFPRDVLLLKLKAEALSSRAETAPEAVQVYDELLKIQPGRAEWAGGRQKAAFLAASSSYNEAQGYLKKGDRTRALKALARAVKFNPESVGFRTHYGWVLLQDGQPALAAETFQEVLRLDPRKQDAYLGLAMAQLGLGDAPGALATTRQGLALFPDDVPLLEVQGEAARARAATLPLAEETYQRLRALRPGDYQPDLKLAQLMWEQGRINGAEKLYEEVLRQDPNNAVAHLGLAQMDLAADAYGLALFHFRAALAAAPDNQEAARGLKLVEERLRPQFQTQGGAFEDSDTFRRRYVYSSWQSYLTRELLASIGYGYLNYTMNNDPLRGRLREQSVHRQVIPLAFSYRPFRQLVLELGGAFSDYGKWGQSGAGRAGLYYQLTGDAGIALAYAYYDVIDYYGPFRGPWGRQVDEFADMSRYRYWIIDPTGMWAQNLFGASSTQAVTRHIRAQDVTFWGYQNLLPDLTLSLYGSVSPYNDGNLRQNLGTTLAYRVLPDPLLKVKYSFFYLGFQHHSADLAGLPRGSAPLYWDPIGFKNHAWGVVLEKNWWGRLKLALEGDLLYNPGAPSPGALVYLELDYLLTRNLALRGVGFYLNSVNNDRTSYQVRNVNFGIAYRF